MDQLEKIKRLELEIKDLRKQVSNGMKGKKVKLCPNGGGGDPRCDVRGGGEGQELCDGPGETKQEGKREITQVKPTALQAN